MFLSESGLLAFLQVGCEGGGGVGRVEGDSCIVIEDVCEDGM